MDSLPPPPRRVHLFADWDTQSSILIRCLIYGLACVIYLSFMFVCTQWSQKPELALADVLKQCGADMLYWVPGLLILAPLAMHDLLRASARIVGPVVRLQREMKLLLRCQSERPIRFRDGDHWTDLGPTYNQVRGELLLLRRQVAEYEAAASVVPTPDEPPADELLADEPQPAVAAVQPAGELPPRPQPAVAAVQRPAAKAQPAVAVASGPPIF